MDHQNDSLIQHFKALAEQEGLPCAFKPTRYGLRVSYGGRFDTTPARDIGQNLIQRFEKRLCCTR